MATEYPHRTSQQSQGCCSGKPRCLFVAMELFYSVLMAQSHSASGFLQVNMDPTLWDVLHEATHLARPPLCVSLPPNVRVILSHADPCILRGRVTMLQSVVQSYNELREGLLDVDVQLFQSKLQSIDNVGI